MPESRVWSSSSLDPLFHFPLFSFLYTLFSWLNSLLCCTLSWTIIYTDNSGRILCRSIFSDIFRRMFMQLVVFLCGCAAEVWVILFWYKGSNRCITIVGIRERTCRLGSLWVFSGRQVSRHCGLLKCSCPRCDCLALCSRSLSPALRGPPGQVGAFSRQQWLSFSDVITNPRMLLQLISCMKCSAKFSQRVSV